MAKPKGPKWADVHDPKQANRIDRRGFSYSRKIVQMGKTRIWITCPFCKGTVEAYLWSLAGGGKRCDCGALFGSFGECYHFADRKVP